MINQLLSGAFRGEPILDLGGLHFEGRCESEGWNYLLKSLE